MAFDPNLPNSQQQDLESVLGAIRGNENDLNDRIKAQENLSLAATKNEVVAARGSRNTVNDRLNQSLNANGDLKFDTLRSMMWPASNDVPAYVDTLTFTVNGNRTGTYLPGLLLRFTLGSVYAYADVSASSYAAGTDKTTITLRRAVLTAALSAVSIGVAALNREDINLPAINKLLASTANIVAVKVYDTRRDSDGGAWRKKCNHTSWYNETLNTATRGASREFPAIALIVAETDRLTIYDATQADLPMWMVFLRGGSNYLLELYNNLTAINVFNATLLIGKATNLYKINFVNDSAYRHNNTSTFTGPYRGVIADRHTVNSWIGGHSDYLLGTVNDVAVTVLPGTDIDRAGLPKPTIACATVSGVSIIHNNATVTNSGYSGEHSKCVFDQNGNLYASNLSGSAIIRVSTPAQYAQPSFGRTDIYSLVGTDPRLGSASSSVSLAAKGGELVIANDVVTFYRFDGAVPARNAVAYLTKDYTSGWMPGDIRLAALANSKTADRSVKGNDLTEVGVVSEELVATGAELKSYSGFSAENYLSLAYTEDFDFGVNDWSILFWLRDDNLAANATDDIFSLNNGAGKTIIARTLGGSGVVSLVTDDGGAGSDSATGVTQIREKGFAFCVMIRRGALTELWINARLDASRVLTQTGTLTDTDTALTIGTTNYPLLQGAISLFRMVSGAMAPAQISKIYEAEKPLFAAGAKCLLGGASNTVTALSYDAGTDALHVASDDGVSVFKGLQRTNYIDATINTSLTTDTIKAIDARTGVAMIGSAGEAVAMLPEHNIREDLGLAGAPITPPEITYSGVTVDATPTVIWSLSVAEGEELDITISVRAAEDTDIPGERASYSKRATVYRSVNEDVMLVGIDDLASDRESTGTMDCVIDVNTTTQCARIKVTGVSDKTIKWTGSAKLTGGARRWAV
ncbi:LamG domain-containing protein [Thalassospira marina]|nr:LamG domain-containing protein [Thalassospira marina]